jgi:hypothetical protein
VSARTRLYWRNYRQSESDDSVEDRRFCQASPGDAIVIRLIEAPRNQMPGALAYSMPFEGIHIQSVL